MTNANRKRQLAVETAAKEGLRASVPLYIAAADAFVQEDRPAQGVELLGELLRAKEKRRGLFAKVEKNPLGPERARVAVKYAELARMASPTEDTLELLEDLAVEFQDTPSIRRAKADGLRNAGYAADAIEEYTQCSRLEPNEADIPVRLSELNAALGHTDEAIGLLRHGIRLHAAAGEYEQVADRAMRFIDLNPDDLNDVFESLELIPGEVLRKHVPSLDHLGMLVRRDASRPEEWRAAGERRLVDLYTRVLEADGRNAAARRGINVLGQQYLVEVEARLKAGSAARAQAAQAAVDAVQASIAGVAPAPSPAPAAKAPSAPAPPPPRAPAPAAAQPEAAAPELVERSPGELIAEEAPSPAPPPVQPPLQPAKQAAQPKPVAPAPKSAPPPQPKPAPAPAAPPPAAKPVTPAAPPPVAKPVTLAAPAAASAPPKAAAPPPKPPSAPPPAAKPVTAPAPAAASTAPPPAAAPPPVAPRLAQVPAPAQAVASAATPASAPPAATAAASQPAAPASQPAAPAPLQVQAAPTAQAEAAAAAPTAKAASAPSKALYAFALRKAQEQFDAESYEEAAQHCERILKRGEIAEVLQLLVRCYLKLERKPEAVKAGLRFADAAAAEDPAKALESLGQLVKELPDPALVLRRSQLLSSLRQMEYVSPKA